MVDEELTAMARSYGMDPEQFKKSYANPEDTRRLKDDLLVPAVMEFLYNNAKISQSYAAAGQDDKMLKKQKGDIRL